MKIPTPVKCKDCGGENDLDCPCTGLIESAKELHPEPANDEPGLILRLLAPLRAGYYVVDRP
jgi:hypothetical protein